MDKRNIIKYLPFKDVENSCESVIELCEKTGWMLAPTDYIKIQFCYSPANLQRILMGN